MKDRKSRHNPDKPQNNFKHCAYDDGKHLLKSDKEATLASIDAALEYLVNNNLIK